MNVPRYSIVFCFAALSACSTFFGDYDGPGERISASSVDDAVPKAEPRSKYGNPESYVVNGVRYKVMTSSDGYVARGVASWYGSKFHGRRTSSGEPFDMYRATAAHKSLPLPTYAQVTNLANGKQVIVKINDRGPFHADRLIDLSYGAAVKIDLAKSGTGRVEVRVIDGSGNVAGSAQDEVETAPLTESGTFIQVGAFREFVNAQEMRARVNGAGVLGADIDQSDSSSGEKLYKVRVGPFTNSARIDGVIAKLQQAGITDYKLVRD
ncbi:MAG: septal ring lytic transglycosylase RlpA family protein [Pseudomonadota bacterium]